MTKYRYQFTSHSFKQLQKLPPEIQRRIIKKLDYFCKTNPVARADKLTDPKLGSFRFRIGDYRLVFDLEDEMVITILLVGHRKEVYRQN